MLTILTPKIISFPPGTQTNQTLNNLIFSGKLPKNVENIRKSKPSVSFPSDQKRWCSHQQFKNVSLKTMNCFIPATSSWIWINQRVSPDTPNLVSNTALNIFVSKYIFILWFNLRFLSENAVHFYVNNIYKWIPCLIFFYKYCYIVLQYKKTVNNCFLSSLFT